jgi:hypothetical protein
MMRSHFFAERHSEDWFVRALSGAAIAATAMLGVLVLVYGLAAVFAQPNPLVSPDPGVGYLLMSAQVALAFVGALGHGAIVRSTRGAEGWLGLGLAWVLWLIDGGVLLPFAGAGLFGWQHGAGPLLAVGTLAAYLVFGGVLGALHGPLGDRLLGPDTSVEAALARRALWSGTVGLVLGALAGALMGTFGLPALANATGGQVVTALPAAGLALAFTLLGGALGLQAGMLTAIGSRPTAEAVAAAAPMPVDKLQLRVVDVHGPCLQGFKPGDTFSCSPNGELAPALCADATAAIRANLATALRGDRNAPRFVACPFYEHMLLLEVVPASA